MRRGWWIIALLPVCGCVTVASLEHSSLEHGARAQQLAQLGDGWGAKREKEQAAADQEEAHRRAQMRGAYWESEVLMH
jgi:hypothetical protein